jgi:NADH-quinone oxidoreductase subunit A
VIRSYLPAIVFVGLGAILGLTFAVLNSLVGPRRKPRWEMQADPYECGLPSDVKKNFRFGISFYLIAMLFILFDIEVVFLYPVGVSVQSAKSVFVLVEIGIFVTLLLVALVFVWARGALDWR